MSAMRWAMTAVFVFLVSGASAEAPRSWTSEWPKTDFSLTSVGFKEIFSGGPPKDGIPSIDKPKFTDAATAGAALAPTEPVMSVALNGEARAYPLRILIWHEIVNDTIGDRPIAVTYCPLCNSGAVFERTVAGAVTTFGTTGKLRNSDLVMYDRATESWWQQYQGQAIVGERLGTELTRVPARLESIADFVARHPNGQVLVPVRDDFRDYGRNPYAGYDSAAAPFLYSGTYDGPGRPLMRVVAVGDAAWSLDTVRKHGTIESGDVVIRWTPGQASALDTPLIAKGRDVGTVIVQRRSADGTLADIPYDVPFAFAFRAFHSDAPIVHEP